MYFVKKVKNGKKQKTKPINSEASEFSKTTETLSLEKKNPKKHADGFKK